MSNEEKILEILGQIQIDISGLKEGQKLLEQRQTAMEQRLTAIEQRLTALEQGLKAVKTDIAYLKESLETTRASVINIELKELPRIQAALDGAASAIERGMDNERRITRIEKRMESLGVACL